MREKRDAAKSKAYKAAKDAERRQRQADDLAKYADHQLGYRNGESHAYDVLAQAKGIHWE